jgi:hypothetical protein
MQTLKEIFLLAFTYWPPMIPDSLFYPFGLSEVHKRDSHWALIKMGEAFWRTKQPPAPFVEEKCL